jgi:hypothetical protein
MKGFFKILLIVFAAYLSAWVLNVVFNYDAVKEVLK